MTCVDDRPEGGGDGSAHSVLAAMVQLNVFTMES